MTSSLENTFKSTRICMGSKFAPHPCCLGQCFLNEVGRLYMSSCTANSRLSSPYRWHSVNCLLRESLMAAVGRLPCGPFHVKHSPSRRHFLAHEALLCGDEQAIHSKERVFSATVRRVPAETLTPARI